MFKPHAHQSQSQKGYIEINTWHIHLNASCNHICVVKEMIYHIIEVSAYNP